MSNITDIKTHWLQNPNKNYLGHWDLPDGKDLILTIKEAKWEEVKNPIINTSEAKRVVRFEENVKPFICNETNAQAILKSTGIKFMEDVGGKKIQLYVTIYKDKRTKQDIDCLRVRTDEPVIKKEEITPNSDKWVKAKEAVQNGSTFEDINKHYSITKENYDLLCS